MWNGLFILVLVALVCHVFYILSWRKDIFLQPVEGAFSHDTQIWPQKRGKNQQFAVTNYDDSMSRYDDNDSAESSPSATPRKYRNRRRNGVALATTAQTSNNKKNRSGWLFATTCEPSGTVNGWPNMYWACGQHDGVHWVADLQHASTMRPAISSYTWLLMEPCSTETSEGCTNTCHGKEVGVYTVAGVPSVYCDGRGNALIQSTRGRHICDRSKYGMNHHVTPTQCGYLSRELVQRLAAHSVGVRLVDKSRDVEAMESTATEIVDALRTGTSWHDVHLLNGGSSRLWRVAALDAAEPRPPYFYWRNEWDKEHIFSQNAKRLKMWQADQRLPTRCGLTEVYGLGSTLSIWGYELCLSIQAGRRFNGRYWGWLPEDIKTQCQSDYEQTQPMTCYLEHPCPTCAKPFPLPNGSLSEALCPPRPGMPRDWWEHADCVHIGPWDATVLEYLFRRIPQDTLRRVARYAREVFPEGKAPDDMITVHMRRTDKLKGEKAEIQGENITTAMYVEALSMVVREHNLEEKQVTVFVITEDETAVPELEAAAPKHWRIVNFGSLFAPGGGSDLAGNTMFDTLAHLLVGLEAKHFVFTSLLSNWARVIYYLRERRRDKLCNSCTTWRILPGVVGKDYGRLFAWADTDNYTLQRPDSVEYAVPYRGDT